MIVFKYKRLPISKNIISPSVERPDDSGKFVVVVTDLVSFQEGDVHVLEVAADLVFTVVYEHSEDVVPHVFVCIHVLRQSVGRPLVDLVDNFLDDCAISQILHTVH